MTEMLVIGLLALLVLGPDKVPEFARTLAKLYREVRTTGAEFSRTLREEVRSAGGQDIEESLKSLRDVADDTRKSLNDSVQGQPTKKPVRPGAVQPQVVNDWTRTVDTMFDGENGQFDGQSNGQKSGEE